MGPSPAHGGRDRARLGHHGCRSDPRSAAQRTAHDVPGVRGRARGVRACAARWSGGRPGGARSLLRDHGLRDILSRDRSAGRSRRHYSGVRGGRRRRDPRSGGHVAAGQDERFAFTDNLTLPLRAREIGQFSFASSAARANFVASALGTSPLTSSSLETTVQLSPTLSNVTLDRTSSRLGGVPARASPADRAIAKHDACAAASSSSGLDFPAGASVRALQETGRSLNFPLDAALTRPVPLMRSPFQTARASLVAAMSHLPIALRVRMCRLFWQEPRQRLVHRSRERRELFAGDVVACEQRQGGSERGALGLVALLAMLVLPGDEGLPTLGHVEDRSPELVPSRPAVGFLDRAKSGTLGVPVRRDVAFPMLIPAPRGALNPGCGECSELPKEPFALLLAHASGCRAAGCARASRLE